MESAEEIVFVRPGDLHLETEEMENFRIGQEAVMQINKLIKPDFVQFAGDNVQHAKTSQFELFGRLTSALNCPWEAMVGDHDVHEDSDGINYQKFCGTMVKAFTLKGVRFIRLNTLEHKPVGFSDKQLDWFEDELTRARDQNLRIVVFQHHYPFKVMEQFDGPGIPRWRRLVNSFDVEAILCGHTHYGQIANDGVNISIATRSIGDPEGGEAGYHIFYLKGDRFANTYRAVKDKGPILLITSPRAAILARNQRHIVNKGLEIEVLVWSETTTSLSAILDSTEKINITKLDESTNANSLRSRWVATLSRPLSKGPHELRIEAVDEKKQAKIESLTFIADPTGRYTAVPRVEPWVDETRYC